MDARGKGNKRKCSFVKLRIKIYVTTENDELLDVLRKMEGRGALDIAGRTKQIAGQVFRYGIQTGKCEWDVAQNLTGALKTHRREHFRALDTNQLPDFH